MANLPLTKATIIVSILCFPPSTNSQLNPSRIPNSHIDFVQQCMEPYLTEHFANDEYMTSYFTTDDEFRTDMGFRANMNASIVELSPRSDEEENEGDDLSLSKSDIKLLHDLATCTAWIGRNDPWGEMKFEDWDDESSPTSDLRSQIPLTDEIKHNIWDEPFEHICPGSHSEERYFNNGENGGNRVVYLQEFLQTILPDVYWKLRATAHSAVLAGKEAGLFAAHEPLNMLGVREVEYIEYVAGHGVENHLSWHRDTGSVYTMLHMLDEPNVDFEGGLFSVKTKDAENVIREAGYDVINNQTEQDSIAFPMGQGRGVLFESETHHGVSSVTKGRRKVMVIEFWQYGEVDAWEWRPDLDQAYRYPSTVLDTLPKGCRLDKGLYQHACWDDFGWEEL
mmetsp:Transcript_18425/g.22553  ORF Transcript_18425/g.22553 Transcript_18425/m.22553 type:complete len:394 (+) Transcript_18425:113-1294(+)